MENKKYLIYNPGTSTIVYDDGRDIAPNELLYVSGKHIPGLVESGTLIQKKAPDVMPDDVDPVMYDALRAAFDDAQERREEDRPQITEREEDKPKEPVRNTGTKNGSKTTGKEA